MPDSPERLANRLADEGQKTLQFFQALAPDQWEHTVYTEGAPWTVRQVLAHFVISEAGMRALMTNVLAGGPNLPQDFDLNRYNEGQVSKWDDAAPPDLLVKFHQERQTTVDWVRGLAPDDLVKTGRHPWLGVAPLEEIIQLMYRHNQIHQREIRKVLAEI